MKGSETDHVPEEETRWVVDGRSYDFKRFMEIHPGGRIWFRLNRNRDVSILFHTYHANPFALAPILRKYEIQPKNPCSEPKVIPKLGIPPFLLPVDYDANRDTPVYDFNDEDFLLPRVRKQILKKDTRRKVQQYDILFDRICSLMLVLYAVNWIGFLSGWGQGPFLCSLCMVVLRTVLSGFGHYYVHRKKPCWGEMLFDMNYVGTCLTGFDGHVMLHHAYTHTGADIKSGLFTGMWRLPSGYRFVSYTLHKLFQLVTGIILRGIEFQMVEFNLSDFHISFWVIRLLLLTECIASVVCMRLWWFLFQFTITVWLNTFLVLSSHDFHTLHHTSTQMKDWGRFQVELSYDLSITGYRWIDLFLSAGLSPHRVHHLLPYQRSGFANLVVEDIIRKECNQMGIPWKRPKSFWTERLPRVFDFCFLHHIPGKPSSGTVQDYCSFQTLAAFLQYLYTGFVGIGSI